MMTSISIEVSGRGRSHCVSVFLLWCGEKDLDGVLSSGIRGIGGCKLPSSPSDEYDL